jgi:hypothetical protein
LTVVLVLDSGGVTRLAERSRKAVALQMALRSRGLWPPRVPTVVLVECLQGHAARDAQANRLLKACHVLESAPYAIAPRAASLRRLAGRGSAVDALVMAFAEPGGTVLTSDVDDLHALAQHARTVAVERV